MLLVEIAREEGLYDDHDGGFTTYCLFSYIHILNRHLQLHYYEKHMAA